MSSQSIPEEQVVAFVLGEADSVTAAEIRARIDGSPSLRLAVEEARRIVTLLESDDSADAPPSIRNQAAALLGRRAGSTWPVRVGEAVRAVAELVYDSRRRPALAGFRGDAETVGLRYRSDLGTVELTIEPRRRPPRRGAAADIGSWEVQGQLSVAGAAALEVVLVRSGTQAQVARTRADERGCFCLPASAGVYDIVIELGPGTLVVPELSIGER